MDSPSQPEITAQTAKLTSSEFVDNGVAYEVLKTGATAPAPIDEVADLRAKLHSQQQKMLQARRPPSSAALARAKGDLEGFKRYGAVGIASIEAEEPAPIKPVESEPPPPDERTKMATRIASLEAQVESAHAPRKAVYMWAEPKIWLQILAGTALLILIVRLLTSPLSLRLEPATETATASPPQTKNEQTPEPLQSVERSIRQAGLGTSGNQQFETSLQRLMLAIAVFPNDSFQSLVRRANENRASSAPLACPFEWNSNGELALILNLQPGPGNFVTDGMDRCAEAIQKLRHPQAVLAPKR